MLCIPDILINNRQIREVIISHAHSILVHLGAMKTIGYLREIVWWKGSNADIDAYCKSCHICQTTKSGNHVPYGLLETLDVPSYLWEVIGINFMGPLPVSKNITGIYDMILVIVDHLSAMVSSLHSVEYRSVRRG